MEEEDQIEQDPTVVNFIPCLRFVKRGVAKEQPDKVCFSNIDTIYIFISISHIFIFLQFFVHSLR